MLNFFGTELFVVGPGEVDSVEVTLRMCLLGVVMENPGLEPEVLEENTLHSASNCQ